MGEDVSRRDNVGERYHAGEQRLEVEAPGDKGEDVCRRAYLPLGG